MCTINAISCIPGSFFQRWIRHSLVRKCPKNWVTAKFPWVRAIFLEFCPNLAISTGKNWILGKNCPILTIFSWVTANISWVRAKILKLGPNLMLQNPWVRSALAKKKPELHYERLFSMKSDHILSELESRWIGMWNFGKLFLPKVFFLSTLVCR